MKRHSNKKISSDLAQYLDALKNDQTDEYMYRSFFLVLSVGDSVIYFPSHFIPLNADLNISTYLDGRYQVVKKIPVAGLTAESLKTHLEFIK